MDSWHPCTAVATLEFIFQVESVPLALQILDGAPLKTSLVKVERAKFNLKGEFDVETAKKRRLKKNEKKRLEKAEAK